MPKTLTKSRPHSKANRPHVRLTLEQPKRRLNIKAFAAGLTAPPPRTPQPKDLRKLLGLSQEEMARVLGCSTRAVAGWEASGHVGAANRKRVVEIARLGNALAQLLPPNDNGHWLRAHNPAFENRTPIEIIAAGESDRLWQMVHQVNANVAT